MGLTSWLKDRFTGLKPPTETSGFKREALSLDLEAFAVQTAVNLIAGTAGKCEVKTFRQGKPVKENEYYLWNYEPNRNQSAAEFRRELVTRLLLNNEALVVEFDGQLILAESFSREKLPLHEDRFTGISRQGFAFQKDFLMRDVLYFKLNNENIKRLLSGLCGSYTELLSDAATTYKRSGGMKGIVQIGSRVFGPKDAEQQIGQVLGKNFRPFLEGKNAVMPLLEGYQYIPVPEPGRDVNAVSDIKTLADEVFERAAQAFQIPPALLTGNIADVSALTDNLLTFCLDPLLHFMEVEMNRKRYGKEVLKGNRLCIDSSTVRHIDIFNVAAGADKLISSSLYSINELREKIGAPHISEDWADRHVLTKNYTEVEMKGGKAD